METVNRVNTSGVSDATALQIEALLGEVEAEMGPIPADRRGEFLDEMRNHLYAMLAARMSDGLSEAVAWKNTRHAFGEGHEIGRDLAEEWTRKPRIETQGAPLSRRDKALLIARPILALALLVPIGYYATPFLRSHGLESVLFLIVAVVLGVRGFRNAARNKIQWTPTAKWGAALAYSHVTMTWLNMMYGIGAANTGFKTLFSVWNMVFLVGIIILMVRMRRERNTLRPWQASPRYAQSPVAAEQEYRLNPVIGMTVGLTVAGLLAFGTGATYFGAWTGIGVGGIVLTLGVMIVRWLQ